MTARPDILAGRAYVSLGVDSSKFTKALDNAQQQLTEFGQSIVGIGARVMAVGGTITGVMTGAVVHFAAAGDALHKMAARTGVSAGALAELGFAAEQSGKGIEDIETSVRKMQKTIGDAEKGSAGAADALARIGTSAEQLQGLSPEDQFTEIAERIGAIEDPTRKAAVAMDIFGRSGTGLLPMLGDIRALREEARELGLAPSDESVQSAADLTDAINRVRRVIGATIYEIGATIAPMAQEVMAVFQGIVSGMRKFVTENRAMVVAMAKVGAAILAVGAAIVGLGTAFIGAGVAIGVVSAAIKGVIAGLVLLKAVAGAITAAFALVSSPILLIGAAIAGATAAWLYFTQSGRDAASSLMRTFGGFVERIRAYFGELYSTVAAAFAGIRDAIAGGDFALAGNIAMTALRLVFLQGLQAIQSMFGDAIGNIIGTFGRQISGGDFAGAWQTVLVGMNAAFESFSNSIVTMFTGAAKAVIEVWRSTMDAITNYILQEAAKGGVIGYGFQKMTGVNVKDEVAQAEKNRRDEAEITARRQAKVDDITAKIEIETDPAKLEELREQLAGARADLESLGGLKLPDIFDQVASGTYQSEANKAIADRLTNSLDKMQEDSSAAAEAARDVVAAAVAGGADESSAEVRRLRDELLALQQQAAESRDTMRAAAATPGFGDEGPGGIGQRGPKSVATFSAAGALAMNQGGAQDAVVKAAEKQVKVLEKIAREAKEQTHQVVAALNALGLYHA